MARSGIYKSEVVRARENLMAQGRHPSIDALRIELGNTGSKATIHRYRGRFVFVAKSDGRKASTGVGVVW